MNIDGLLTPALQERRRQQLYRQRITLESAQARQLIVDGKRYLGFCSNDYLGLANHPKVRAAFVTACERYGVGSGASHLVCGHSAEHHALEAELADFLGRERALLFSSGYMANLGVVNALLDKSDAVFEDKLNHASLLDAGQLSGANFQRFLHNDLASLGKKLTKSAAAKKLIVVDGVFSMDGDLAELPQLAHLADQHKAILMVDDAHGFGCLGTHGRGVIEHFALDQDAVPVLMCTLGKALGCFGAVVSGSGSLIEYLIQFARTYVYTTALPPALAAATRASLALLREEAWRRDHLNALIKEFRSLAQQAELPLMESQTAIQPLLVGSADAALRLSEQLKERGILISAIRPPTVPPGTARLRITLSADHSLDDVNHLVAVLSDAFAESGLGIAHD